jgi:hypothetical protein
MWRPARSLPVVASSTRCATATPHEKGAKSRLGSARDHDTPILTRVYAWGPLLSVPTERGRVGPGDALALLRQSLAE